MNWIYKNKEITSLSDMPDNAIGFIYRVSYEDDSLFYIGKKNLIAEVNKMSDKKPPKNVLYKEEYIKKINKKMVNYTRYFTESNWRTYQGSCKLCKTLKASKKEILEFAFYPAQLTYLEVKYQFLYSVLEDKNYLNDNILGKFYGGRIYGTSIKNF